MQNPKGVEQEAEPVTAAILRGPAKEICREPENQRMNQGENREEPQPKPVVQ